MDSKTYHSIRMRLDFSRKKSVLARHLLVDTVLIATALLLLIRRDWASYLTAQPMLATVFFRQFSLMHDAVHGAVLENRSANNFVGLVSGVLCFLPFESWRRLHLEHHLWAGNIEKDPSSKLRKDFDPNRKTKYAILSLIWRSWIPVMALLQQLVFWGYPVQQLRNASYRRGVKWAIAASLCVPWITYGLLRLLMPSVFNVVNFGPAFVLYLMMVELINFPHHMDVYAYRGPDKLPYAEQYQVTRSSAYPSWFARFFLLNFNLHVEHHLFPNLPWYHLEEARALLKPVLGNQYQESEGNEWILKNRRLPLEEFLPLRPKKETREAA